MRHECAVRRKFECRQAFRGLFISGTFQVRADRASVFEGNGSNEFDSDLIKLLGWIFFEGIDDDGLRRSNCLVVCLQGDWKGFSVKYELILL